MNSDAEINTEFEGFIFQSHVLRSINCFRLNFNILELVFLVISVVISNWLLPKSRFLTTGEGEQRIWERD